VVRAMREAGANSPERWRKDDHGQKEEDAGDFEPEDPADAAEGGKKSGHTPRDSSAGFAHSAADGQLRVHRGRAGWGTWGRRSGLGGCRDLLTDQAPGDPDPDAQQAACVERVHIEIAVPI